MVLFAIALAAPAPTAAEAERLDANEVVIRDLPAPDGSVAVLGLARIDAPADALWNALLDFPGRLAAGGPLKTVAAYRPATPTEQWVRWEASRFGVTVVYHNHYVLDRAHGTLLHELDPTRPNDLSRSRGLYEVSGSGTTWQLAYTVETDFGRALPGFIQDWLAGSGVRSFLEDLVARAEAS